MGGDKVVIVGGGFGIFGVVEGFCEMGYIGFIIVISNEGYLFIDRLKFSKVLLIDLNKFQWRDVEWYKEGDVDIVQDEVVGVDFVIKMVLIKFGGKFVYSKFIFVMGVMLRVFFF